jgi:hypothetical protein
MVRCGGDGPRSGPEGLGPTSELPWAGRVRCSGSLSTRGQVWFLAIICGGWLLDASVTGGNQDQAGFVPLCPVLAADVLRRGKDISFCLSRVFSSLREHGFLAGRVVIHWYGGVAPPVP